MASEGPKLAGTGANDASFGTAGWGASAGNITAEDGTNANVTISNITTQYLKATNFSFSIPAGATIDGIVVEAKKSRLGTAGSVLDTRARIVKGGAIGATDRSHVTAWTTTLTWYTYGSSSDKWGETWTVDDINASNFGFVVAAVASGLGKGGANLRVDAIRITVHYTEAATGQPAVKRMGGVEFSPQRMQSSVGRMW